MKNVTMRSLLTLLVAAVLAGPLLAQYQPIPPRQRVQQNLSAFRLIRLTQFLDLTEEQTARVFPVLNRIEKSKQDIQKDLSRDVLQLRRMSQDPETPDAAFEDVLVRVRQQRVRIKALDEEGDAVLAAALTPRQKALYEIFQIDFLRGLTETMNQVRQRAGRGLAGEPPAPVKKK